MSYDDFWFIDTRVQTRNLRRWFIWFILLFAFVTIGSIVAIRTMYYDMTVYEIHPSNPIVTVSEAKRRSKKRKRRRYKRKLFVFSFM